MKTAQQRQDNKMFIHYLKKCVNINPVKKMLIILFKSEY